MSPRVYTITFKRKRDDEDRGARVFCCMQSDRNAGGNIRFYKENGKIHRDDEPAWMSYDGKEHETHVWAKNGKIHRGPSLDGTFKPAVCVYRVEGVGEVVLTLVAAHYYIEGRYMCSTFFGEIPREKWTEALKDHFGPFQAPDTDNAAVLDRPH